VLENVKRTIKSYSKPNPELLHILFEIEHLAHLSKTLIELLLITHASSTCPCDQSPKSDEKWTR